MCVVYQQVKFKKIKQKTLLWTGTMGWELPILELKTEKLQQLTVKIRDSTCLRHDPPWSIASINHEKLLTQLILFSTLPENQGPQKIED